MKSIGKPCAGKSHARFDEGGQAKACPLLYPICCWWNSGWQFWLFTLYDKDEMENLNADEKKALKGMLKAELEARR